MNIKFQISNFKYQIFILLFVIGNYLTFVIPARAEGISLAIDPPIFQIQAVPPAQIQSPFTIENRSDIALDTRIELKPFIPSDQEDGLIKYVDEKDARFADPEILKRVSIINEKGEIIKDFRLEANEKKNLTLSINLPKDSPQSDYYFSILFLSSGSKAQTINSSEAISGIASNVLLSVGSGKATGEISEFSTPPFIEKGPTPFTLRVKNTSNHFITPKGEILIRNIFGETLGRVDLPQENILANSVRNLSANWPENVILGPYRATLSITLSDTGPLFRRDILFFAFPFKTLGGLIAGLIVLLFITLKVKQKV